MRKTIFASTPKAMRQRLNENLYLGWVQVGNTKVVDARYEAVVEKVEVKPTTCTIVTP